MVDEGPPSRPAWSPLPAGPTLTRWQQRARRRARAYEHVVGVVFGLLAVAALVYFGAVTSLISPLFTP